MIADAPPVRVRREIAGAIGWTPAALRDQEDAGIVQVVDRQSTHRTRL